MAVAALLCVLVVLASSCNANSAQRTEHASRFRRRTLSAVLPVVNSVVNNVESFKAKLAAAQAQLGTRAGVAGVLGDVKEMVRSPCKSSKLQIHSFKLRGSQHASWQHICVAQRAACLVAACLADRAFIGAFSSV